MTGSWISGTLCCTRKVVAANSGSGSSRSALIAQSGAAGKVQIRQKGIGLGEVD
jgi:hypothetical protein